MPHNGAETKITQGIPLERAHGLVLLQDTPKGRGVFACQPIARGTVIEVSPVLVLRSDEVERYTSKTVLDQYTYNWPSPSTSRKHTPSKPPSQPHQALALGLGSLFNHSRHNQNIGWRRDTTNTCIVYTALRDIGVGEELCINYGIGVWFEDVDALENQERGEPVNGDGSADKSGGWRPDGMAGDEGGEREEMVMMRVLGELVGD